LILPVIAKLLTNKIDLDLQKTTLYRLLEISVPKQAAKELMKNLAHYAD